MADVAVVADILGAVVVVTCERVSYWSFLNPFANSVLTIVDFEVAVTVAPAVAMAWLEEDAPFEAGTELDARKIDDAGTPDVKRMLDCANRLPWSGRLTVLVEASGGDEVKLPCTGATIVVDLPEDESAEESNDVELPWSGGLIAVEVPTSAVGRLVTVLVTVLVPMAEVSGNAAWDDAEESAEVISLTVADWEAITVNVLLAPPMAEIETDVLVSPLSPAMGTDDGFWRERDVPDVIVVVASTELVLPGSSGLVAADDGTSDIVGGMETGVAGMAIGVCASVDTSLEVGVCGFDCCAGGDGGTRAAVLDV